MDDEARQAAEDRAPASETVRAEGQAEDQAQPDDPRAAQVCEALRRVVDPEMSIDVVRLGLIRDVRFDEGGTEIVMILTTPFCPYGGYLIQQVVDAARSVVPGQVRVTMGEEMWSPSMMEDADLAEWGLW